MPTSVSCVIVDDEPLAIEVLKRHVLAIPPLKLLATFTHPEEAMDYLRSYPPQLVFLDIEMPSLSGLALSALLPKETTLIFTTAFRQYATEGFEREALDYLVKPISFDRFAKAINR